MGSINFKLLPDKASQFKAIPVTDRFIDAVFEQEGLLPFQTPARANFRETYLGFPVKQDFEKPKGREAFIFLENQEDVKPSIKAQFLRYPGRFLPDNATLEEGIRTFDKSNAEGKIRYIKQKIPEIDLQTPINTFFGVPQKKSPDQSFLSDVLFPSAEAAEEGIKFDFSTLPDQVRGPTPDFKFDTSTLPDQIRAPEITEKPGIVTDFKQAASFIFKTFTSGTLRQAGAIAEELKGVEPEERIAGAKPSEQVGALKAVGRVVKVIRWPFWRLIEQPVSTIATETQKGELEPATFARAIEGYIPFKKVEHPKFYENVWSNYWKAILGTEAPVWYGGLGAVGLAMGLEPAAIRAFGKGGKLALTRKATPTEMTFIKTKLAPMAEALEAGGVRVKNLPKGNVALSYDKGQQLFLSDDLVAVLQGKDVRVPRTWKMPTKIKAPAKVLPTLEAPAVKVPTIKPTVPPVIITDPVRVQEIKNSIAEGELILKSGKKISGEKMTAGELEIVRRSVANAKAKIGLPIEPKVKLPELETSQKTQLIFNLETNIRQFESVKPRTPEIEKEIVAAKTRLEAETKAILGKLKVEEKVGKIVPIPKGWKMVVGKTRTKEGKTFEAEVDWQNNRIVFAEKKHMDNPDIVNHEIAHVKIETLANDQQRDLFDEYIKIKKLSDWVVKNQFHREEIAMDFGVYLTNPSKVASNLKTLFDKHFFPKKPAIVPRTIAGIVKQRGGIDPTKAKRAGFPLETFREFGIMSVIKKGGAGIDDIADQMQTAGELIVPADMNPSDALMEQLKEKAKVTPAHEFLGKPAPKAPARKPAALKGALPAPEGRLKGIDTFEGVEEGSKQVEIKLFEETKKIAKKYAGIIGEKHLPKKLLGIKWGDTDNIFVQALNDLSTTIHEVVHFVDTKKEIFKKIMRVIGTSRSGNPIYAPETSKVRKALTEVYLEFYPNAKKTHKLRVRMQEGLASFIENYVSQPTSMTRRYPLLVKEFLRGGPYFHPIIPALVKDARGVIAAYQKLDSLKKVGSKVLADDQPNIRESFLNFKEKAITEIIDNVYPLEKLAVEAGKQWTKQDPSLWTRLYSNISGIVNRNINTNKGFVHFRSGDLKKLYDFNWQTLVNKLSKRKLLDDFSYWLVARREFFAYQRLDQLREEAKKAVARARDLGKLIKTHPAATKEWKEVLKPKIDDFKKLNEILKKDGFSRSVVTEAYNRNKAQFAEEADQFDKLVRADLDFIHSDEVGMVSDKNYQEFIKNEGYATLKRDVYNEVIGEGDQIVGGLRVSKKVSSLKGRRGSELTIINPVFSSIKNHSEIMRKGMKQLVINKVVNLKKHFPDIMQQLPLTRIPRPDGGFDYPQERDPNIIMAMDNGKKIPVLVSKDLHRTIDELLTFKNIHLFERLVIKAARMFTKGTTGLYPPFALQNFFVDQITASAQTTTKYKPLISQLNLLYKQLKGHSDVAELYQEYLMLGGQRHTFVGWLDMTPNEFFTTLSKEKTALQRVGDLLEQGFQIAAIPTQTSEILTRAVEYINSRQAGEPQVVALERAGRVSAPFHHIGRLGGQTGRTVIKSIPYFNASLEVLAQFARTLKNNKTRKQAVFVMFALTAAMMGGWLTLMHMGTKKQKDIYKDLHPRELAHYMFFPNPNGETLLRFRVPEQMSAFATVINMVMSDAFLDTRYSNKEYIDAFTSWIPDQFNVTDPIRQFFSWIPHILGTMTQTLMNTRTFPKVMPIEGMNMQRHEARFRFNKNTGWLAKYVGNLLDLSPKKIDYLLEGMFGRTSKFVKGGRIFNPIVRDAYFGGGRRLVEFYELRKANQEKMDSYKNRLRTFTSEELNEIIETRSKTKFVSRLLSRYRKFEKDLDRRDPLLIQMREDILNEIDSIRYTR